MTTLYPSIIMTMKSEGGGSHPVLQLKKRNCSTNFRAQIF